jgi:phenylacetic acid degradation operon negative regulatory protein
MMNPDCDINPSGSSPVCSITWTWATTCPAIGAGSLCWNDGVRHPLEDHPSPAESVEADPDDVGSRMRCGLLASTARSLLLSTLGEFVLPTRSPVWTATLLYVLGGLGVEEQTARQAITRASESGLLEADKQGRAVRWSLTDAGRRSIEEVTRRVASLSAAPARWDGDCLVLVVTVPQSRRAARKRLYRALEWAGFGSPSPGVWASPYVERAGEVKALIEELGLRESTLAFIGTPLSIGLTDAALVRRSWDLDQLAARYQKMIDTFESWSPGPGDDVLFSYIALVNEWREAPFPDPRLPEDILPDWVGRRAMDLSVRLYEAWAPPARRRWEEIVDLTTP